MRNTKVMKLIQKLAKFNVNANKILKQLDKTNDNELWAVYKNGRAGPASESNLIAIAHKLYCLFDANMQLAASTAEYTTLTSAQKNEILDAPLGTASLNCSIAYVRAQVEQACLSAQHAISTLAHCNDDVFSDSSEQGIVVKHELTSIAFSTLNTSNIMLIDVFY